ncbi:unnamed protein product [Cylicostephanus goldi]|uniref:Uncharacterized protein n=1 Tax=Cylicostephanus goldi TaxID=71465 RepID=A0A3P6QIL9_CYLGO|nr:unnamed protein product [Cylicostephanus goldi]
MAIDTAFKRLEKSLQPEQKRHLSERHFAFLEKEQLESIFAKEGRFYTL